MDTSDSILGKIFFEIFLSKSFRDNLTFELENIVEKLNVLPSESTEKDKKLIILLETKYDCYSQLIKISERLVKNYKQFLKLGSIK